MQSPYRFFVCRVILPLTAAAAMAAVAGCGSDPPSQKFQQEFFDSQASPFLRRFMASNTEACEAARRALLTQGYLTTTTRADTIDASKDFQPSPDKHVGVEFHVVCTPGEDAENTSIVYANAVQSGYGLKKSDTSASVGVGLLGSLSLPIRSNSDAMVKVSSETIQSPAFYGQFFDYIDQYLRTVGKAAPVPLPSPIQATALPIEPPAAAVPSSPHAASHSLAAPYPLETAPSGASSSSVTPPH